MKIRVPWPSDRRHAPGLFSCFVFEKKPNGSRISENTVTEMEISHQSSERRAIYDYSLYVFPLSIIQYTSTV